MPQRIETFIYIFFGIFYTKLNSSDDEFFNSYIGVERHLETMEKFQILL